jgi:hypothetical protein
MMKIAVFQLGISLVVQTIYYLVWNYYTRPKDGLPTECKHRWTKWSEPYPYSGDNNFMLQSRTCVECNFFHRRSA